MQRYQGSSSWYLTTLAQFDNHGYCVSTDRMVSVCHVIFHDHVIKGRATLLAGAHQVKLPCSEICWP